MEEKITVGYYVIGFFDILGQKEQLEALRRLPDKSNEEQLKLFIDDLKGTYGVVTGIRRMFEDLFKSFLEKDPIPTRFANEQQKIYEELTNNPIQIRSFSDSIIACTSLRTDEVKLPTRGIWGIMASAASIALLSLAAGHPIRGGIDIGLGMEIEKGEIYGPCLSMAYTLESKIAQYPRIVVGKECMNYLYATSNLKSNDIYSKAAVISSELCLSLTAVDDDGCVIVDYLGETYRQSMGNNIENSIIEKAHKNIIQDSEKHRNSNNTKMAFRYTLLRNYFEHRMANWIVG